jgi:DNA-binding XRE family transcriptional regulator
MDEPMSHAINPMILPHWYSESVDSSPACMVVFGMDEKGEKAIRRAFGVRVRELRKKAGFSQEELATAADLDRSYIGGVERGERNVSLVNIHKIARGLKVKPEALFE